MKEEDFTPEKIKELEEIRAKLKLIEDKLAEGKYLSFFEIQELGNLHTFDRDILDLDERLKPFKFKEIYTRYKDDLTFSSDYYKRSREVQLSQVMSLEELSEITSQEYDDAKYRKNFQRLVDAGVYVPLSKTEVGAEKRYLEDVAKWWGQAIIDDDKSDSDFSDISKETLKHHKVDDIKNFIKGTESVSTQDTFIGLMKSYYVYCEAKRIFERINFFNEPSKFLLNGKELNFTFNSLIHVINRHFAQLVSISKIAGQKSFHNTKIDPYKLNFLFYKIFDVIEKSGVYSKMIVSERQPIHIEYFGTLYTFYLTLDSSKSNLNISTFYEVDREGLRNSINKMNKIKLSDELFVFIN